MLSGDGRPFPAELKSMMKTFLLAVALLMSGCTHLAGPPDDLNNKTVQPYLTENVFVSADDYKHPIKTWLPKGEAQQISAVIVALHGFNDYSNAFAGAGETLSQGGVAVYAYDQRGFGNTAHQGYWHGRATLAQDLHTFLALIGKRHQGVPLFVLGDSMGGAVTLKANAMKPLDVAGIILVAPAVWGRETMPWYQRFALWLSSNITPWAKVTGSGLGITPSDNEEMLKKLGQDPLVIKESRIGSIWGLTNLMDDALLGSSQLHSPPTLLLYGKKDQIIPQNAIQEMIGRLPEETASDIKIAIYEDGYHMLLRDLQGHVVIDDIAAWVQDPYAPLPSQADLVRLDKQQDKN